MISVAIIGAGIGGLAAAASLLRAGFDVHVYEQARALGEVGAGINIGPNASRLLHRLGLAEVLEKTGIKPVTFDSDDGTMATFCSVRRWGKRLRPRSAHRTTPSIGRICIAHWRVRFLGTACISRTA